MKSPGDPGPRDYGFTKFGQFPVDARFFPNVFCMIGSSNDWNFMFMFYVIDEKLNFNFIQKKINDIFFGLFKSSINFELALLSANAVRF